MTLQYLTELAVRFTEESESNYVQEGRAIKPELAGLKMFDAPTIAVGSVCDEEFELLKDPDRIGGHFMTPKEWMPDARAVISIFLPFTDEVKNTNRRDMSWPSDEWLHARIEGQVFVNDLVLYLQSEIERAGYKSVIPGKDARFSSPKGTYTSNWSERHVAYVCGLGTFGLSKGLITRKGTAGRFTSLVTSMPLPASQREYADAYEYCSMCGKCAVNCPANAISVREGKNHAACSAFVDEVEDKCSPWYGCGKCQVGVPCESGIPVNCKTRRE